MDNRLGRRHVRYGKWKSDLGAWALMIPGLILFAFFIWEPLLEALRLSLYETKGMRLIQFVGLENFRSVFSQPDFWPAVRNTFLYMLWSLLIGYLIANRPGDLYSRIRTR